MSFDIAYHAINKGFLENELLPYFFGEKDNIDNILFRFAKIRQNRFIANYFSESILKKLNNNESEINLLTNNKVKFDPWLHIWGRPFLVVETEQDDIGKIINSYCNANNHKELLSIIVGQIKLLGDNLYDSRDFDACLESMPTLEKLVQHYKDNFIPVLKGLFAAAVNQKEYISDAGEKFDPKIILSNPFILIEFIHMGFPAWMDNGLVCPSQLIVNAGLELPHYIKNPVWLLGSKVIERLGLDEGDIMPENYSLGIIVDHENISDFIKFCHQHRDKFKATLSEQGLNEQEAELTLKKINEALYYCLKNQCIFVESTDIFSGFNGVIDLPQN